MAKVIFYKKDLKPNTIRPILKDGVVKQCPHCKQFLTDDQMRALTNGLVIACMNCNTIIEGECK